MWGKDLSESISERKQRKFVEEFMEASGARISLAAVPPYSSCLSLSRAIAMLQTMRC